MNPFLYAFQQVKLNRTRCPSYHLICMFLCQSVRRAFFVSSCKVTLNGDWGHKDPYSRRASAHFFRTMSYIDPVCQTALGPCWIRVLLALVALQRADCQSISQSSGAINRGLFCHRVHRSVALAAIPLHSVTHFALRNIYNQKTVRRKRLQTFVVVTYTSSYTASYSTPNENLGMKVWGNAGPPPLKSGFRSSRSMPKLYQMLHLNFKTARHTSLYTTQRECALSL